jgi:hypothetical protein
LKACYIFFKDNFIVLPLPSFLSQLKWVILNYYKGQYPNSGNNQWGNINQNQNQNNNYAYGYENTNNATNNKPQINTYGYPDNSNTQNNNSGWGQSPIQQQQNLPTNWQANNNTNVYQNNNSGWGKPMGNT